MDPARISSGTLLLKLSFLRCFRGKEEGENFPGGVRGVVHCFGDELVGVAIIVSLYGCIKELPHSPTTTVV